MSKQEKKSVKNVVAVCGNEARIYGERDEKTGVRPFVKLRKFTNHGQARAYAIDYENPELK